MSVKYESGRTTTVGTILFIDELGTLICNIFLADVETCACFEADCVANDVGIYDIADMHKRQNTTLIIIFDFFIKFYLNLDIA